jgi:hypothetical protein
MRRRLPAWSRIALAALAASSAIAAAAGDKNVKAGETWIVDATMQLDRLTVAKGARVQAPPGKELTLTVDGVETPLRAGEYQGRVVLESTEKNVVDFSFGPSTITHHFRQALFVGKDGVDRERSVASAAGHYVQTGEDFHGISLKSVGEDFNGVFVAGGRHTFADVNIDFTGDGDDDFAGFGAAFMTTGPGTSVVLDRAHITTRGAVRSAVIATNGSSLVVKNSFLEAHDGVLPADYVPNVDPGRMKSVPWMLGLTGTNRATNILGDHTHATYVNSTVSAENWGGLSNDISNRVTLTAIDSRVVITGQSGYGAFSLGGATTSFYGSELDVKDFGVIVDTGGSILHFGASEPDLMARLNEELALGLTPAELRALPERQTVVKSRRFGMMLSSSPVIPEEMLNRPRAFVEIKDGTGFDTGETVFLDKGLAVHFAIDGSNGARLHAGNGILLQVMESDDPGVVMQDGAMLSKGVYHEPSGPPVRAANFDVATPGARDVQADFANIALVGDFFNGFRDGTGGFSAAKEPSGKNLILQFNRSQLVGMISATNVRHRKAVIAAPDYPELSEVTNTPAESVNNGVIVVLRQSSWTPTATCHLTSLALDVGSAIQAPAGATLSMTVDGKPVDVRPGAYRGHIVLDVARH